MEMAPLRIRIAARIPITMYRSSTDHSEPTWQPACQRNVVVQSGLVRAVALHRGYSDTLVSCVEDSCQHVTCGRRGIVGASRPVRAGRRADPGGSAER